MAVPTCLSLSTAYGGSHVSELEHGLWRLHVSELEHGLWRLHVSELEHTLWRFPRRARNAGNKIDLEPHMSKEEIIKGACRPTPVFSIFWPVVPDHRGLGAYGKLSSDANISYKLRHEVVNSTTKSSPSSALGARVSPFCRPRTCAPA